MNFKIKQCWKDKFSNEFEKPYFKELCQFVIEEYAAHTCYPQKEHIFNAFNHFSFEQTKIVILGQDPYHGPNQANGLCFSVNDGVVHPPSLRNIFKELENDLNKKYPKSGNLTSWAEQGVLLLNSTLTVKAHKAGSHQKMGWERFTDATILKLSEEGNGIVFMLWGGYARKKKSLIDTVKHLILESGHPSPLSANRGYWFNNGHFSKANTFLKSVQKEPVNW